MESPSPPDRRAPADESGAAGQLEQRLEAIEAERDRIFADEAVGKLPAAEARSARRALEAREDALAAKVRRLEQPPSPQPAPEGRKSELDRRGENG